MVPEVGVYLRSQQYLKIETQSEGERENEREGGRERELQKQKVLTRSNIDLQLIPL